MGLKEYWETSEKHRKINLDVIRAGIPEKKPSAYIKTFEELKEDFLTKGVRMKRDKLLRFFLAPGLSGLRQEFAQFIQENYNREDGLQELAVDEVLRVFLTWKVQERAKLLQDCFEQDKNNIRQKLTQRYAKIVFKSLILHFDLVNKATAYTKYSKQSERDTECLLSENIESAYDNYRVTSHWMGINEHGNPTLHMQLRSLRFKDFLRPTVRWQTKRDQNTGSETERVWIPDRLPEDQFAIVRKRFLENGSIDQLENNNPKRLDPLAGLIMLKYFSPNTGYWPPMLGLPEGEYEQEMGIPQLLVLAQMNQKELINTELIKRAENYADNHIMA